MHLPPIYTLLHAMEGRVAIEVLAQLDAHSTRGIVLTEDTRKIIEYGRLIRACLKQPEFAPVSVPAQIAVRPMYGSQHTQSRGRRMLVSAQ